MFKKIFGGILIGVGIFSIWFGLQVMMSGELRAVIIALMGLGLIVAGYSAITNKSARQIFEDIMAIFTL